MLNSIIYFEENCTEIFEKLENDFLKNPTNFAGYVYGLVDELHKLGRKMIKESLEIMDRMLQKSPARRKQWTVEAHHSKTLTTYLGDITFQKTLFRNKETKEASYLIDRILELEPNQRLTEDAVAEMLKEAAQTSYRRGGERTSLDAQVSRQSNEGFWDAIYRYLDRNYDLEKVKKIYLNADGGGWIKAGMKRIAGVTYVLGGFHLEKYLVKLTSHLKKERREAALEELQETIRKETKKEFKEQVERQKKEMPEWRNLKKVDEAAEYILSNWTAAKLRLKGNEGIVGSSTESHVSHALSDRMSSRPKGWSRKGAEKMAKLRAYCLNGGDLLELVRYQKKAKPEEKEGKELLSSTQIIRSEKNRHGEVGKYLESISHSVSEQVKKMAYFNAHIWGL